jgi:hypothetical protein
MRRGEAYDREEALRSLAAERAAVGLGRTSRNVTVPIYVTTR